MQTTARSRQRLRPPRFFPETFAAQKRVCRPRCDSRCNRRSCPCQAWPRVSARSRAPGKYAETRPNPAWRFRSPVSAPHKIHPAYMLPASHARRSELRRHLSRPARSRTARHLCQLPERLPCSTYPSRFAAPPPASRNSRCSTSPAAVRRQQEFSWLDHPRFKLQLFDQLCCHFLGRAGQKFGFLGFRRHVNFFDFLSGFGGNTERLPRHRSDLFLLGRHDALERRITHFVYARLNRKHRRKRALDMLEPPRFQFALELQFSVRDLDGHDQRRGRQIKKPGQQHARLSESVVV